MTSDGDIPPRASPSLPGDHDTPLHQDEDFDVVLHYLQQQLLLDIKTPFYEQWAEVLRV